MVDILFSFFWIYYIRILAEFEMAWSCCLSALQRQAWIALSRFLGGADKDNNLCYDYRPFPVAPECICCIPHKREQNTVALFVLWCTVEHETGSVPISELDTLISCQWCFNSVTLLLFVDFAHSELLTQWSAFQPHIPAVCLLHIPRHFSVSSLQRSRFVCPPVVVISFCYIYSPSAESGW